MQEFGLVGWLATESSFTPEKFAKASSQEMLFRHFSVTLKELVQEKPEHQSVFFHIQDSVHPIAPPLFSITAVNLTQALSHQT